MQHRLADRFLKHTGAHQTLAYLSPRHRPTGECLANHRDAASAHRIVEAEILAPARTELVDRGAENADEPAQVVGRTEMQRPAHQPCAHHRPFLLEGAIDRTGGEVSAAHAHLVTRGIERLRLERAHRARHRRDIRTETRVIGEVL